MRARPRRAPSTRPTRRPPAWRTVDGALCCGPPWRCWTRTARMEGVVRRWDAARRTGGRAQRPRPAAAVASNWRLAQSRHPSQTPALCPPRNRFSTRSCRTTLPCGSPACHHGTSCCSTSSTWRCDRRDLRRVGAGCARGGRGGEDADSATNPPPNLAPVVYALPPAAPCRELCPPGACSLSPAALPQPSLTARLLAALPLAILSSHRPFLPPPFPPTALSSHHHHSHLLFHLAFYHPPAVARLS